MTPTGQPTAEPRPQIRKLPPLLVNQIAAGEVIERPASIVKELVENAIDADAGRIRVELESGGIELVRVTDDGRGIGRDQLPLALEPHATSKIAEPTDLDRIGTLGFRGEALASIASVARVTIRSRTADEDSAWVIEAADGVIGEPKPAAGPPGTMIEARTLFHNTPARRKFLRTPRTEQTRCVEWLRDLALAHPAVAFTVVCDGRTTLDLPPNQPPRARIIDVLGREHDGEMLEVRVDRFDDARGVLIWGLVGLPSIARPTAKAQHVFLNGRLIRDRTVQHALKEAYRGLIEPGRHPTAVLVIEMAPDAVDVNVHPAKLEVRFRDQSMVHSAILHGVRDALRRADLTPAAPPSRVEFGPGNVEARARDFADEVRAMRNEAERRAAAFPPVQRVREALEGTGIPDLPPELSPLGDVRFPETGRPGVDPAPDAAEPGGWASPRPAPRVLQVHRSYLVTEDERGIVIIDQHALHERVMFEKLLDRLQRGGGSLESQGLLTPAVVEVEPRQADRLDELKPLLARLGIEADAMGPKTVGVRAFPTLLLERGVEPGPFMADLLERHDREGFAPGDEAALHEVLDMMACKAAVKAGDSLTDSELDELMALRQHVERAASCPHGRPTTVRLSIEQLEKLFHRR
ncbi:MAG TPA: DNA mismatch repair endonuclease MutL [Phycisphaerales bacterium]|nr:DNA mismatch repair endonuclease MutL [Phycisphaerales bacterium]